MQRRKSLSDAKETYIDVIFLFWLSNFPCCWQLVVQARRELEELRNETRRRRHATQQILIRYVGLGIEETHRQWSEGNTRLRKRSC